MTAAKKKRTGKAAYEVSTHFFTAIVTGSCRWQTQLEEKEIRWGQRMKGRVAKYYLTDGRRHTDSEGYKTSVAFEKYLADCGLQVATDRDFGITALRWAEIKAGKETVRTNIRQEQQVKSVARANQPNVAESISNHKKSTVQKTQMRPQHSL